MEQPNVTPELTLYDSLAAFLRARLDEDEAAAKAVKPLGHVFDMGGRRLNEAFSHTRIRFASEDGRSCQQSDPAAERHFGRHDPARVLREVEAARALLAEWEPRPGAGIVAIEMAAQRNLRLLAAVYSDHPDYRQEWAGG